MTDSYRLEDAEIAIVSYGVSARTSLAAVDEARERGIKVGMLKLNTVWPFPEEQVRELARRGKVFCNGGNQFGTDPPGGAALCRR